jgi:hypothetical protein
MHPLAVEHRRKLYERQDAWRLAPPGTPEAKMPGWLDPSMTRVRWREAQEAEARRAFEREIAELRASHEHARQLLAEIKYDLAWRKLCRKYGYNPDQPRDELGRWTGGVIAIGDAAAVDSDQADEPKVQLASWEQRVKDVFGQKDLFTEVGAGRGGGGGAPELPSFRANGPTAGVLRSPGKDTELVSGEGGPASRMPAGSRGFDGYTMEHVEGHAAATMRELKIQEGTLYINHPNGPCPNCDSLLNRMLPSGARLEVVWPRGAKTYEGIQP